jgi:anti-anti-sigma factor
MSSPSIDARTGADIRSRCTTANGGGNEMTDLLFHITTGAVDERTQVVEPHGDLDMATVGQLQAVLEDMVESGTRHVILDLEYATFLDSRGVVVMVASERALSEADGKLVIVCASPHFRRLISLVGDATVELTLVSSRREALQVAAVLPA